MAARQTLVQLTDQLVAALDEVAGREGRSRSEIVRAAVRAYLDDIIEAEIDRAIIEGYERQPQRVDAAMEALARDAIAVEPW